MRSLTSICLFVLGVMALSAQQPPRPAPQAFEFRDGDRVVFLGDTWMEREQAEGHIEARITSRLGGKNVIFRNLAL